MVSALQAPEACFTVEGLEKAYGSNRVLSGIDLRFSPGKVYAVLGANGAGKSTLIKCLSGATAPTAGAVVIGGERYSALTPRTALDAGIAVIYQHFSLIASLSVADNVFLGSELHGAGKILRRRDQEVATRELFDRLGVDISPRERLGDLSVAHQQLVEIAKAIHRRARLLILDEPTASLSDAESRSLIEQVARLRDQGLAIIYVTHLLDEVFRIADEVIILRDGRVSLQSKVADVSPPEVIEAIAGVTELASGGPAALVGEPVLTARGLEGEGLGPISLELRSGEIVGVFGLLGSGRTELLETLFGIRPRTDGEVLLDDRPLHPGTPAKAIARGLALVPADRLRQSIFPSMSTSDNLLLAQIRGLGRLGIRHLGRERRAWETTRDKLRVRAAGPEVPAWTLSGGNQQKLAVGRWLGDDGGVRVLLLDDPTQGIDVGARGELYRILRQLVRSSGCAVLFTSSSPEEVTTLADRAIVMHEGTAAAELSREQLREDRLLALANRSQLA
jgi:ABC-type sugar transport system ATPase subunit